MAPDSIRIRLAKSSVQFVGRVARQSPVNRTVTTGNEKKTSEMSPSVSVSDSSVWPPEIPSSQTANVNNGSRKIIKTFCCHSKAKSSCVHPSHPGNSIRLCKNINCWHTPAVFRSAPKSNSLRSSRSSFHKCVTLLYSPFILHSDGNRQWQRQTQRIRALAMKRQRT